MITKIDRYIIGKFFKTFGFTVMIFILIATVIDFAEKINDFIESELPFYTIFIEYTINFTVYISALLIPLYVLIAVIFFTSRMATDSEVISIFNAGVSYRRFLRPFMLSASLITIFHLFGNHILFPMMNKTRLEFQRKYVWNKPDSGKTEGVHLFTAENQKIFVKRYNKTDSIAYNVRLESFENGNLVSTLKASQAKSLGTPGRWKLKNYEIRDFHENKESYQRFIGKAIDTTLLFFHDDFITLRNFNEELTSPQLLELVASEKKRGAGGTKSLMVEFYKRTAEPFTSIILTLIAVAIASRKTRGGIGVHLAIGVALGALYVFISKFSVSFAQGDLVPPWVGIWIPNTMFLVIGLFLVTKAQK